MAEEDIGIVVLIVVVVLVIVGGEVGESQRAEWFRSNRGHWLVLE